MALNRTQWNRLQNSFPPEDRVSYEDYLSFTNESESGPAAEVDERRAAIEGTKIASGGRINEEPVPTPTEPTPAVPTPTTVAEVKPFDGIGSSKDDKDDAYNARIAAEAQAKADAKAAKKVAGPGAGKRAYIWDDAGDGSWVKPAAPGDEKLYDWNDETGWKLKTVTGNPPRPAGTPAAYTYDLTTKTWVKPKAPGNEALYDWNDETGWKLKTPTASTATTTSATSATSATSTSGGFTQADIDKAVKASQEAATKAATDAAAAAAKTTARKNMIEVLYARFKNYGLETLAKKIEQLAIDGATDDTITLQLQETEEYKTRFKANTVRVKNDLKYLSPAEYLNLEDSYRQVLRAYGLKTFDTDAYVSQFIANDMSPTELSNRVVTAVQRVRNADPAVSKQLRDYYGIGQEDLVAYVLDPQQQFQKIERQVAASEIGVAAGRQGLTAGVTVAEQLAAQGITQAEAQKGYATIADILPSAEKLSDIYGKTVDVYGQAEGEQEVFNSLASAQRKRQRLSAAETGTFGASSGMNRTSLTGTKPAGQY